jgi:hypothetical protein
MPARRALLLATLLALPRCDDEGASSSLADALFPDGLTLPDGGAPPSDGAPRLCTGVDCTGLDGPCARGECDPDTGDCVAVAIFEGDVCDDGDNCTHTDVCAAGLCVGDPVVCPPEADPCQPVGCNATSGDCQVTVLADATPCDDSNACTSSDRCQSSFCIGDDVDCTFLDDPCNAGVCDSVAGCTAQPRLGDPCDDADLCTDPDACDALGQCAGTAVDCTPLAGPCASAACNPGSGTCDVMVFGDTTPCTDGDLCTTGDQCASGQCLGAPVSCPAGAPCVPELCEPTTGACVPAPLSDGVGCEDGDLCTYGDQCMGGSCVAAPVDCSLVGPCAACNPASGACDQDLPDSTSCDGDPLDCVDEACNGGSCVPTPLLTCSACGDGTSDLICSGTTCEPDVAERTESFEGASLPAGWMTSGAAAWAPDTALFFTGVQAARSGPILDSEQSTLSHSAILGLQGTLSYAFRTSSEASLDELIFYVNGVERRRWSGNLPWGTQDEPLAAPGRYAFDWTYQKDGAGAAFDDAAWLDEVVVIGEVTMADFEDGTLGAFTASGDQPWAATTVTAQAGTYSAGSGAILDSQTSSLFLDVDEGRDAVLGFWYSTDTEDTPGLDELQIFRDGTPQDNFSGAQPWVYLQLFLTAGPHTIEWRYVKDASGSVGGDQVFIDDVFLDPLECP